MRWIRNFGAILILVWIVGACLKQPELSIIPQITFQSATLVKGAGSAATDTIILTIGFADGDGDLGYGPDETAIYKSSTDSINLNPAFYFLYDSTKPATSPWYQVNQSNFTPAILASLGFPQLHYVDLAAVRKNKNVVAFDTLPSPPTCKSWTTTPTSTQQQKADTIYTQNNPNANNIFMNIYTAPNAAGPFTYYDPYILFGNQIPCPNNVFDGRYPVLSSNLGNNSPIQGTLTWKYISPLLYYIFQGKTIRLTVYITDRALHKSNVVTSNDIVIN